jgi:hypothetical protein
MVVGRCGLCLIGSIGGPKPELAGARGRLGGGGRMHGRCRQRLEVDSGGGLDGDCDGDSESS